MTKQGMTRREAEAFLAWLDNQSSDTLCRMCAFLFKMAAKKLAEGK